MGTFASSLLQYIMHKHLLLQCYVRPVDNASHVMPQTALAGHNLRPAPFVAVLVMRGPLAAQPWRLYAFVCHSLRALPMLYPRSNDALKDRVPQATARPHSDSQVQCCSTRIASASRTAPVG